MKKIELIKTCEGVFNLFDKDSELTQEFSAITNEPYFNSVADFLEKQEGPHDKCLECWNRLAAVAFAHGFVMALMLKPNSRVSFKGIQKIGATIEKAGLLPLK